MQITCMHILDYYYEIKEHATEIIDLTSIYIYLTAYVIRK